MNARRLSLFLSIFLLCGAACAYALSAREYNVKLFAQGNSEYQKGNYESAVQYYSQILNSGADNGPLYYNLGNACFKLRRLGEAIYYWEKARQLLPGDSDIRQNLELANLLLVDRIEVPADPVPLQILAGLAGWLTIVQGSWLVLILFMAGNLLFSAYLVSKTPRSASRALIACLGIGLVFIAFACSLSWRIYEKEFDRRGVVIEQKVDVRSGPGPENITVFTIHEGIKVRVHESSNGWYQISLPNGWSGWLQQNYLRVL